MTGPDFDPIEDDDGPETFRPLPHPDDRLWRHPSEIAAMHAAQAHAETAELEAITVSDDEPRSRLHVGLALAAGVVAVGAAALTLGVISGAGDTNDGQIAATIAAEIQEPSADTSAERTTGATTEIAVEAATFGEERLAARVHDETSASLPRVTAATSTGMREGSGLFVTDDGHIATSAGLIDNADYILAWTDDDQRWKAQVVAVDTVSDVAILQIDSADWPAIALSTGVDVRAGQYALALDYDEDEISLGEVTAIGGPFIGFDQPAAMPGSAILDDRGAVIAMVTADGSNSYGTPAWMLEQVAVDLISSGSTTHTWLGLLVEAHPSDDNVVTVSDVVVGSPAHHAGLRPGDLIDSMNGEATLDTASFFRQIHTMSPGEEVVLTVTRNGSRRIIIATVAARTD